MGVECSNDACGRRVCVECIDAVVTNQCKSLETFIGSDKNVVCTSCSSALPDMLLVPHLSPEASAALSYARANADEPEVPPELLCPILLMMMVNPIAIGGTGHIFEHVAIKRWFEKHSTSPLTGLRVPKRLEVNDAVRLIQAQLASWREAENKRREFFGLEILPPPQPITISGQAADFSKLGADIARTVEVLLAEAPDDAALLAAVQSVRRLLSTPQPPAEELLQQYPQGSDLIPRFVQIVATRADAQMLRFEAAWALTNFASGPTAHCDLVRMHGAVPVFVEAMKCAGLDLVEQCCWGLGNISGDSQEARDECLYAGAMTTISAVWKSAVDANGRVPLGVEGTYNHSFVNTLTWTLSNLCRGYRNNKPRLELVTPGLDVVAEALAYVQQPSFSQADIESVSNACWALSHITHISNDAIGAVVAVPNMAVSIVACARLLQNPSISKPILRAIGNIISGDNQHAQVLIDLGIIPLLFDIFKSESRAEVKKEQAWTFSNITAGTPDQIQALIESSGGAIVPHLLNLAVDCRDPLLQKELLWTIANLSSSGSLAHVAYLVSLGVIPKLCEVFNRCKRLPDALKLVAETLYNILNMVSQAKEEDLSAVDNIFVSLLASEKKLNSVCSSPAIPSFGPGSSSGGGDVVNPPATLRQEILQQLDFQTAYSYLKEHHAQLSQRGEQILRLYQDLAEHAKKTAAQRPQVFSSLSVD